MDDRSANPYARAPHVEDLKALCDALNRHGVRYVLIGGFAVILHGYVRATKDIDLLLDPAVANVARLKQAMSFLPDNAVALVADEDLQTYGVVRVGDEIVVDLMAQACGVGYEEALRLGVVDFVLEGVTIPLASVAALIRMKDTVRPSDKADVMFLRVLCGE